jgi:hypothetical protein
MSATEILPPQKNNSSSGATLSVGPFTYTAGNLILVWVTSDSSQNAITVSDTTHSVTASVGLREAGATVGHNGCVNLFYFANATGGSTTIQAAGLGSVGATIVVQEFSNLITASPLDKTSGGFSNTAGTAHATGTTATTTQAVELAIAGSSYNGSGTAAPSAVSNGYTLLTGTNDRESNASLWWPLATARLDLVATGTTGTTFTWVSNPWAALVATFIEATGGGTSDIPVPLRGLNYSTLVRM